MLDSFGARLRKRREEQGVALLAIAEQTKIKLSLFEGLERDDVSHWPSGIFRRAFIRAYAHAIGLDPDLVVREFVELYPEPVEVVATASAIASGGEGAPPTRLRSLVDSAIDSLTRRRRSPDPDLPSAAYSPVGPGRTQPAEASTGDGAVAADPAWLQGDHTAAAYPPADPGQVDSAKEPAADRMPRSTPVSSEPDFLAAANLCTELGRVETAGELQPLLEEAVGILDARGLIVWVWDAADERLRPALAHGYSEEVLAQLPALRREADNATAAAFRSGQTCAVRGGDHTSGALVVPLLTPAGCAGVLALEVAHGGEQAKSVRAVATVVAAQLAQLIGTTRPVGG